MAFVQREEREEGLVTLELCYSVWCGLVVSHDLCAERGKRGGFGYTGIVTVLWCGCADICLTCTNVNTTPGTIGKSD